jgi:autotransporter-associated beta strand protein
VDDSTGGGNGGLENIANNNTWTGKITTTGGRINSDSGTLTVGGGISGSGTVSFGGAGDVTVSTTGMSGGMAVEKDGEGTLTLDTANTYTGGTTLTGGQITLGANGALGSGGFNFAGGILNANDRTASVGAMSLTANSTLNFTADSTSATLTFSSANDTSGAILTINGWSGSANSAGTDDHLFISANPGAAVLADIDFTGYANGAIRLSDGEIVPVPEPITWALMIFAATVVTVKFIPRLRRRVKAG